MSWIRLRRTSGWRDDVGSWTVEFRMKVSCENETVRAAYKALADGTLGVQLELTLALARDPHRPGIALARRGRV